jgi:Cu+-exporting ATPase
MQEKIILKSTLYGILASGLLLGVYFVVLTLVSGWNFAQDQFLDFWYFIVSLAIGFGIQIGLSMYLKDLIKGKRSEGKMLGVTGVTSTTAMVSCCTHYLASLLPILGTVGIVTFVAQYQIELFWVGILFNLGGIAYIANKIFEFFTQGVRLLDEQGGTSSGKQTT